MSKGKQIEEMAKDVTYSIVWDSDGYATVDCLATAQKLHLKGYRKQSEVVREFAEEVKLEFYREFDEIIPSIMADKIDDLVKKYTEDEK